MTSYSRYNLIITPLTNYAGEQYNTIYYKFDTLDNTYEFIRKYILENNINMFEIQEEFHIIKKNDHQISRIILERILCYPHIWENMKTYEFCSNYVKNAHSNWY
jgi:hypothetical protein